ncbi:hypothetical protein KEJ37_06335 [Candidatus Bathyarchaeota archaeon]|nr:hypothetical protein [Candidatus Bathyarchaeota archaeon]
MGLLDIFRRKKKEEAKTTVETRRMTELEQLCADDKEAYEALVNVMFLDPRKIGVSMEEAAENAKKFEKEKDFTRARLWYHIAGGLAIYEGNVKKVVEYFGKCEKLSSGTSYPILKNPERAVAKAQEYYKKFLQS